MHLGLLQIADSAVPIGGYTHSWGLETAVSGRAVHDPETLERWTALWLRTSLAPLEGVLVANACRAGVRDVARLQELNDLADVSLVAPTTRRASREMGEQLMHLAATWGWSANAVAPHLKASPAGYHHPVAFGLLGAAAGALPLTTLTAYLYQAAMGVVGAGVRGIPIGHTNGQQVMAYLHELIDRLAAETADKPAEVAGAGCPSYEILCDEQTRLYARMFRS